MSESFREFIFVREGGYCLWCGKPATDLSHLKHYGMGRNRDSGLEDKPEQACALCHGCHMSGHAGGSPTKKELQGELSRRYGYIYD